MKGACVYTFWGVLGSLVLGSEIFLQHIHDMQIANSILEVSMTKKIVVSHL